MAFAARDGVIIIIIMLFGGGGGGAAIAHCPLVHDGVVVIGDAQ